MRLPIPVPDWDELLRSLHSVWHLSLTLQPVDPRFDVSEACERPCSEPPPCLVPWPCPHASACDGADVVLASQIFRVS